MEKEEFIGKRRKWVKIPTEKDVYINLICQKCGCEINSKFHCILNKNCIKIYCNNCIKREIILSTDFQELNLNEISIEFIQNLLNSNKKNTIFVDGNDLYIDFVLLIRNYREKIEFCNI